MIEIYVLLALFGIKHFLADFVFQYDYMVREKGVYGAEGGIHHAAVHTVGTFFVLMTVISHSPMVMILSVADGIIHYHIDWAKQQLNRGLTPSDRKFWFYIGLDQLLHYLTYIALIYLVVGSA